MNVSTFIGLLNNAALLVALALVFDTVVLQPGFEKSTIKILTGIAFGILGVAVMLNPWEFIPGVFFDTRSVILSVGGLFFGTLPTVVAVLITSVLRYLQGGVGTWTGIAVIVTSAVLGLIWRHKRLRILDNIKSLELYIFGIIVHIAMMLWMMTLPSSIAKNVLANISLPVMILYPIGTVLIGKLLVARAKRKQAEKELSRSEARWRSLTETSPDSVVTLDEDLNIEFANFAPTGMTVSELIGTPFYRYVQGEETQTKVQAVLSNVLKTGEEQTYETEYTRPDGQTIYYESRAVPRRLEDFNRIIGLTVSSRDVTDRKKHDRLIEENEQLLQEVINSMEKAIAIYEPVNNGDDFRFVDTNEFAEKIMHYKQEDVFGKTIKELFPAEPSVGLIEKLKETYTTGRSTTIPLKQYQDDRITQWVENYIFKLPSGKVVAMFEDTSEQRKMEEKLRESEEKFRSLAENSQDYIMRYDKECRHLYQNAAGYKVSGFTEEEFIGKTHKELGFDPDLSELWENKIKQVFATGERAGEVFSWESAEGPVYLDWRVFPEFDSNGFVKTVLGVSRDITEFKIAENHLKEALEEKEMLLHEIHHRVKNNMQIIASLLNLQRNNKEKKDVDSILKENTSRVYAMAAIHESLHQSERLTDIDLRTYLQKLTQMLSQTYSTDPSKVVFQIDCPGLKLKIDKANPLGLVLNELISNSLKYAFPEDRAGIISIQSSFVDENSAELIISDDGVGLPNSFDWKTANTLGLRIVKDIVERQLDGSIDYENRNGTTFTITFNLESSYK